MKYCTLILSLLLTVISSFAQVSGSRENTEMVPTVTPSHVICQLECKVILPMLTEDHIDLFLPPYIASELRIIIGFVNSAEDLDKNPVSPEIKVAFADSLNRDLIHLYFPKDEDTIAPTGELKFRPDGSSYIEPIYAWIVDGISIKRKELIAQKELSIPFIITQNGIAKNFTINVKKATDPTSQLTDTKSCLIPSFEYKTGYIPHSLN